MKNLALLPILLFSLSLSSCSGGVFDMEVPFQLLETDDGVFTSFPNYKGHSFSRFYCLFKTNNKCFIAYVGGRKGTSGYYFNLENHYIMIGYPFSIERKDDVHANISFGFDVEEAFGDNSLADWNGLAALRDALDEEIDAKYYTNLNFVGLDNELILEFVPEKSGYIIDEDGQKNHYTFFDKSSIFTFKLLGSYKGEQFTFCFLENSNFSIKMNNTILNGTYLSSKTGMTLYLGDNEMFGTNKIDLTIDAERNFFEKHFYDIKRELKEIDIEKYMSSDYEFWIQQYDAENP